MQGIFLLHFSYTVFDYYCIHIASRNSVIITLSVLLLNQKRPTMPYIAGYEEDGFLKSLNLSLKDIEVKASGCTEVLVWHTRTAKNPTRAIRLPPDKHTHDNIRGLVENMKHLGMIK